MGIPTIGILESKREKGRELSISGLHTSSSLAYISDVRPGHFTNAAWCVETASPRPLVIYFNSDSFTHTNRGNGDRLCKSIAKRGYLVFNAEFSDLKRNVNVRQEIEDVLNLVKWIVTNSERFDPDFDNVYLMGSNTGAIMAMWLALICNCDRLRNALRIDRVPLKVRGVGVFSGKCYLESNDVNIRKVKASIRSACKDDKELLESLDLWDDHDLRLLPPVFQVVSDSDKYPSDAVKLDELLETNAIPHEMLRFESTEGTREGFMEEMAPSNETSRAISRMFRFFDDNQ